MKTKLPLKKLWLCSAPALCLSAALVAQVPGGGAQSSPQQPGMGQSPSAPSSPTMSTPGAQPGTAPTAQDFSDKAFVSKAMEGDEAEVQLGQLAQQKSQSQDVKQYAKKMVSEHEQMNDKWLKPVARQMDVSEPKGPSKKDKKIMEKLQALSGSDFDKAYIQMMVADHKKDLKAFEDQAKTSQDPNVKQIAEQGAKVISQHLQIAEQLAQAHNVPVEGKEVSSLK